METDFKINDKVVDEINFPGHVGVVTNIYDNMKYPIEVKFTSRKGKKEAAIYMLDGRFLEAKRQVLRKIEEVKEEEEVSSFDYVKYDEHSLALQIQFKDLFCQIEKELKAFDPTRESSLAVTKLEESYMWIGKVIKNDQIKRNGSAELQEERRDG